MEKKRTRGRQKIAIEKIKKENDCFATFSKRRLGLFKKASEISTLCTVDIGICIFSPTGKPFSFFHPSMESVIARFQDPNQCSDDSSRLLEACTRTRVLQLNQMLDRLDQELDAEKEREKQLGDLKNETGRRRGWWDGPVEKLEKEQVERLKRFLENLQSQLSSLREKKLKKPEVAADPLL